MPKLKAEERDSKIKLDTLRGEGLIPAVYYGAKEKPVSISVNGKEFKKIWKEVGETSTVELDTKKGKINVMIHEIQFDPIKSQPIHIDFYAVRKGQKVEVEVPLEFEGVSPAVKEQGAVLVKVLREISIEGEPQNIPQQIIVDVTSLIDLDSQIIVKDLSIPKNVTLITDPDEVVITVAEAKEEEEEVPTEVDMSAIDVEKKGKKEEGGSEFGKADEASETDKTKQ